MAQSFQTASSSSQNFKINYSKKTLLLLLPGMLLIASALCYGDCHDFSGMFDHQAAAAAASSSSAPGGRRSLLESTSTKEQSTMKIPEDHQKGRNYYKKPTASSSSTPAASSKDKEFGMAAHEVPSGPNPESN